MTEFTPCLASGHPDGPLPGVVTLGETMALLYAEDIGPLRHARQLRLTVAGAESNVAIGLRRLGHPTRWLGRVGGDPFGEMIVSILRAEMVDVFATVDPLRPTGLMIKSRRTANTTSVLYYRSGSAASAMSPDSLDLAAIAAAHILHVTGVTPALSRTARDTVFAAVDHARANGVTVSVDVNYREALWNASTATKVLTELGRRADILFAAADEAALLTGSSETDTQLSILRQLGASEVVIKRGVDGAAGSIDDSRIVTPAVRVPAVDPVGAGDAFVAGYLAAWLEGAEPDARMRLGCTAGAFAVTVAGDWEGSPTRAELSLLDHAAGTVTR